MASRRADHPAAPFVLVVGADDQARLVASAVERARGRAFVVDLTHTPPPLSDCDGILLAGGARSGTRLDQARAVYVRHLPWSPLMPSADEVARGRFRDWRDRYTATREKSALGVALLRTLDDGRRLFVNHLAAVDLHVEKPWQLALLRRAKVRVPRSLATSSPDDAAAFVASCAAAQRDVVYKPVSGGAQARLFVDDDRPRLRLLVDAPALFQERIDGAEHRVYVLDGDVIACFALPTSGVVDARERMTEAKRVSAPRAVAAVACAAARALGLVFCAVDVRTPPGDAPVVLEANPTPSIMHYEDPRDGRIVRALANFLVVRARRG